MFDKYFEVDDGFICYVVKIKMPSYRSIIGNHIEAFHVSWGFQQVKIILLFIDLVVFIREKKLKSVRRFKKRLYEITMPLYWLAHHQGLSRKMFFCFKYGEKQNHLGNWAHYNAKRFSKYVWERKCIKIRN